MWHSFICTVDRSFGAELPNSKKKPGRQKSESETIPKPATVKVCSRCYENIYAGCHHQCSENSYRRKKVYNRVILKYATTHNHPQPLATIYNHPEPPRTTYIHPQPQ